MAAISGPAAGTGQQAHQGAPFTPFQSWLDIHGTAAFAVYKKEGATSRLTYDEWKSSEHPLGFYLYQLTLDAWDQVSSDDEELEQPEKSIPAAQPARRRIVPVITNGNGQLDSQVSSASAINGPTEPAVAPARAAKQPKANKFSLSESIPSQDGEMSRAIPTSTKEAEPTIPAKPLQKPKKKSPLAPVQTPEAIVQCTPGPDDRNPTVPGASPDAPASASSATRKGLRTRTPAQQRPYFHHAKLFEEQVEKAGDVAKPNDAKPSPPRVTGPGPRIVFTNRSEPQDDGPADVSADGMDLDDQTDNEPDQQPVPGEKKFKGKGRAWKKDNEDEDDDYQGGSSAKKARKVGRPRKSATFPSRLSLNLPSEPVDNKPEGDDQNSRSIMVGVEGSETLADALQSSSSPKMPKAQRAPRRARKHKSEEFVRDETSDSEAVLSQRDDTSYDQLVVLKTPATTAIAPAKRSATKPEKEKKKPRKSNLSKEIIDDSDSGDKGSDAEIAVLKSAPAPPAPASATKKAAKAAAKAEKATKVDKAEKAKRKYRKSNILSPEFVEDSSSEQYNDVEKPANGDGAGSTSEQKQRRKSTKKSLLSEEFVRSDTDTDMGGDVVEPASDPRVVTAASNEIVTPKGAGRPKKVVAAAVNGGSEAPSGTKKPSLILRLNVGRRLSETIEKSQVGENGEKQGEQQVAKSSTPSKTTPSKRGRKKKGSLSSPGLGVVH